MLVICKSTSVQLRSPVIHDLYCILYVHRGKSYYLVPYHLEFQRYLLPPMLVVKWSRQPHTKGQERYTLDVVQRIKVNYALHTVHTGCYKELPPLAYSQKFNYIPPPIQRCRNQLFSIC